MHTGENSSETKFFFEEREILEEMTSERWMVRMNKWVTSLQCNVLKEKANVILQVSLPLRLCSLAEEIKRSNLAKLKLLVLMGFILALVCPLAYRVWLNHRESNIH